MARTEGVLAALVALGCERRAPPPRPPPPSAPEEVDAGARDDGRRCALRGSPPEEIAEAVDLGRVSVGWDGARFGVAWSERIDDQRAVRFVRVSAEGRRLGAAVRVSEPRTEADAPSVTWNGTHWVIVWSGGQRDVGDIVQARVDPRGTPSRPWRMTRGDDRRDLEPRIHSTGQGSGLAWVAREGSGRWSLYAQSLDRFDAPRAFPARLLDTSVALGETTLLWTGAHWGVAALASRREVLAVDFARMDPRGQAHGSVTRLTPSAIGGVDTRGRYSLAWDGEGYVVAWSEVREGSSHVYLRRADARGRLAETQRDLREEGESADAPAVIRAGDGLVAVAWQVSREGRSRLRVKTFTGDGLLQRDAVELQDADGDGGFPSLASGGDALAVVAAGATRLTFHRVQLGPCPAGAQ